MATLYFIPYHVTSVIVVPVTSKSKTGITFSLPLAAAA